MHPSTAAAHPSTTAKSADASRSHASEAAIALHARHPAVLIPAEDTVLSRRATLFKALISEALLRRERPAIRAAGHNAAGPPARAVRPIPASHLAIGIRHAQPVLRIMHPRGIAQGSSSLEVPEPIPIEEGVVEIK
jgi:hypothetical protein